jgi:peptidyl-prolyl cis-trans isomerase SurA
MTKHLSSFVIQRSFWRGSALRAASGWLVALSLAALLLPVAAQTLRLPSVASTVRTASAPTPPAASGDARPGDFIVAIVNSEPITNNDVQTRLARIEQQIARQGSAPPRDQLAREVLERLILERAQLQLARTLDVKPDEAAVDQAVSTVARQNQLTRDELKTQLTLDGVDYTRFRADLRDELTLVRLREREVDARVKVSEQDIDQFMRERETQAQAGPELLNIAQLLVAVPEAATPDQVSVLQAKAERAVTRLRAGEVFARVAAELSDSADAASGGGELGLRPAERLPTLFVDATRTLQPGGLAGPLRSGAGFHVIQLIEKKRGNSSASVTQTRARHILLRLSPELTESAASDKLADFKRRIAAGQADFASLARDNSQDGSAKDGGDLGWASPGMFVPEFEQVMNQLKPGQVADPLASRFGVHLIEVLQRREMALTEREQRDAVRNLVRARKIDEAYNQWLQDVRGRAYVELRN